MARKGFRITDETLKVYEELKQKEQINGDSDFFIKMLSYTQKGQARDNKEKKIIEVLKLHDDAQIPFYQTPGSAGMDLCAIETIDILPQQIVLVATGLVLAIPQGYEGQVRPRSGLALKGITVANAPGTIDSDYRGEIKVILTNLGTEGYRIKKGDRIAQLIIAPVTQANIVQVISVDETDRGIGGFGSTGI